jgi:hypothetical protein
VDSLQNGDRSAQGRPPVGPRHLVLTGLERAAESPLELVEGITDVLEALPGREPPAVHFSNPERTLFDNPVALMVAVTTEDECQFLLFEDRVDPEVRSGRLVNLLGVETPKLLVPSIRAVIRKWLELSPSSCQSAMTPSTSARRKAA